MAQHDYVIANGTGAAVRSDLNNGLAAIVSNNSGATEPATMYAYQWWADTTTGLLKLRNAANNAWITVGTLASANLGLLASGSTLTAALGSASTPGITFTGDLNTGIFSPGADQVAISTNGTERLRIDSNGDLLSGTTSNLGYGGRNIILKSGQGYAGIASLATESRIFSTWDTTAIPITFFQGGTERMRLDSSNRLLVGTSTSREGFYASTNPHLVQVETTGYTVQSWVANNSINSETGCFLTAARSRGGIGSFTILNSGDSIGHLSFAGADGTRFVEAARIEARVDGTPGNNDMPGRLVFSTTADGASSPTERMRIGNNGTTFFGTNLGTNLASSEPVKIAGNCGDRGGLLTMRDDGIEGSNRDFIRFHNNSNTDIGAIEHNGSTSVAYLTSSDYRLKENVVPLTGAADRIKQIPVHRFNFIAEPSRTVDGFLAHEAQAVVPECVSGAKDEVDADGNPVYQGIDQSKLVPLLTAALQEAIAKIETLEAKVAALEAQ